MARQARGVTTTGYALILGVVAIFIYGTYLALGSSVWLAPRKLRQFEVESVA
jgi:Flp pilus assembly pilin Flp